MTRKKLSIDCDDVLLSFNRHFARFHNHRYGTRRRYRELFSYDMGRVWDCEPSVITSRVVEFYRSPEHTKLPPIAGAVGAIRRLARTYDLEIVTSRPIETKEAILALCGQHFPYSFQNVHFTNGFAGAPGAMARRKSEVCLEIGAHLHIEDALSHAAEVAAAGIPVLLPDRPWNQEPEPPGVHRMHTWPEMVAWIRAHVR